MRNLPCDLVTVELGDDFSFITDAPNWGPGRGPDNIEGYHRHQEVFERFIRECLGFGWKVQLPVFPEKREEEEKKRGDYGIDVVVNELIFDIKSFGLREDAKTKSLRSKRWEGKAPPRWVLTDFLIFAPLNYEPNRWEVGPYRHLRESYNPKYTPFFYKNYVMSFPNFASAM
jgi:hypothetical protein